jgi:hypothetical protein
MSIKALIAVSLFLASPLAAGQSEADPRCGSSIPRKSVKVLDASELSSDKASTFVREQVGGDFEIVRREKLQANTAYGRVSKKAGKKAAALGCPFAVVVSSWREDAALRTDPGAEHPQTPETRDTATILYLKPR